MNEKSCENCSFYIQHYVKRNIEYMKTASGHCGKRKANGQYRNVDKPCEFWEINGGQEEKRQTIIKVVLKDMARQINEIAAILKDDATQR